MGQLDRQALLPADDTEPAAHVTQTAGEEADAVLEKVPAGQLLQAVDPRAAENVPAGQVLQLTERADDADAVPRGQGLQVAAPVTSEKEPGAQGTQEATEVAAMEADDVPTGHLKHAVAFAFA